MSKILNHGLTVIVMAALALAIMIVPVVASANADDMDALGVNSASEVPQLSTETVDLGTTWEVDADDTVEHRLVIYTAENRQAFYEHCRTTNDTETCTPISVEVAREIAETVPQ